MMSVVYLDDLVTLHHGDCRDVLRGLPSGSVDAVVTDPPYELGFMGKGWDASGIAYDVDLWRDVSRVLKPGGHLLAFGGTRTWHRLACAIEDAGFEIRDSIAWLYGSGFPKSLDVSKAIDKAEGMLGNYGEPKSAAHAEMLKRGIARRGKKDPGWDRPWMDDPEAISNAQRKYEPGSDAAKQWQGWGTALKPAHEPIVVARKPLAGTVAANVLAHGTGALNIDGCRIEGGQRPLIRNAGNVDPRGEGFHGKFGSTSEGTTTAGRWPANVVLDEDQAAALNETVDGGASRFFYVAKAPSSERPNVDGVAHPTVKPVDLMRWLVRLVTPSDGVVLEPFAGSGTTLEAAVTEGFRVIGIEREADYLPLILQRISKPIQQGLDL